MVWSLDDWRRLIAQTWMVKQALSERDTLFEHALPRVGASEAQLCELEERLGEPLHPEYRAFLSVAGGWPSFWHDVDLLGPSDLGAGPLWERAVGLVRKLARNRVLEEEHVFPIGVARYEADVFVMARRSSERWGSIVWCAGKEIDRYGGTADYVASMRRYLARELEDLSAP